MNKRLNKKEADALKQDYTNGMRPKDLAKKYKVSTGTVFYHTHKEHPVIQSQGKPFPFGLMPLIALLLLNFIIVWCFYGK